MRSWQWWHVVGLWLASGLVAAYLFRVYANVFRGIAGARGGLQAVGAPLWLAVTLLALLVVLLMVTRRWWRGRRGPTA